jgi:hypothetical protein
MNMEKILQSFNPILLIVLVLALLGLIRTWRYSRNWDLGQSVIAAVVVIIAILVLLGYI